MTADRKISAFLAIIGFSLFVVGQSARASDPPFEPVSNSTQCAQSVADLVQLIGPNTSASYDQIDTKIQGRFKGDKGFYVFEEGQKLYLGIDAGFMGKITLPISVCPHENGLLTITANLSGKPETITAQMIELDGRTAIRLTEGTGALARFNGDYIRQDMSLADIRAMFDGL